MLWDVNLEIGSGEIIGIFGRSGSGKTMIARVLAGIEEPSNGSVESDGSRISVALGAPAFAHDLTVFENLNLFASLWKIPRRRRTKEIAFLLELLKLNEWRASRASILPSRALDRLEIARALLADSPVLVIDSLLDNLDQPIFEKLWDHLLALRRNANKSIIVMTSSGRVAECCGKVAVIHRGRISFIGRPDDFRKLAGEDMVVLGDVSSPLMRSRIEEKLSVVIQEQDGFLSFRVANGERMVSDLLSEFGSDLSCVYLKRPTLEDALDVLNDGNSSVTVATGEGRADR